MARDRENFLGAYNLEVLRGNIPGHSMISMRGHDHTVPNGGPFGLSPQFGGSSHQFDQSALKTTPAAVAVASTDNTNDNAAGTGALTVRITGLDSNGDGQTANETMNGTTEVTCDRDLRGQQRLRNLLGVRGL